MLGVHALRPSVRLAIVLSLVSVLTFGVMPAFIGAASLEVEEQPGSIQGAVTTEEGTPLAGASVVIWRWDGGYEHREVAGVTETAADGSFQFEEFEPGVYRMMFGPSEDKAYAFQCYGSSPTLQSSWDVYVSSGARSVLPTQTLPAACSITGAVVNPAGQGIDVVQGQLLVRAYYLGDSGWEPAPWLADPGADAGSYQNAGLPPGTIRLGVQCRSGVFVSEFFSDASSVATATDIPLASLETTRIDFQLAYAGEAEATQVAGVDRYGTAIEASKRAFPDGAQTVVVATGANWPDALGGAGLAGAVDGPILLTRPGDLPDEVLEEIERLDPVNAIILGGTGAVSASVEASLVAVLGSEDVTRVGGIDRYATANLVARAYADAAGDDVSPHAIVATGLDFPDALAMSAIAVRGMPILLAGPSGLSTDTASILQEIGTEDAFIAGGTGAVSPAVETALKGMFGEDGVVRLAGVNRYETAVAIADHFVSEQPQDYSWNGVALATGADFPDALAGGVMQGAAESVLLLTPPTTLHAAVRDLLDANSDYIATLTYLGGTGAISQTVRDQVTLAVKR